MTDDERISLFFWFTEDLLTAAIKAGELDIPLDEVLRVIPATFPDASGEQMYIISESYNHKLSASLKKEILEFWLYLMNV